MSDRNGDYERRYVIIPGDRYAADQDSHFFNLIRIHGSEYGGRWLEELNSALMI